MSATDFELLGKLEDEFEQEAMELEPVVPRQGAGSMAALREMGKKLIDPLPYGCIDVSGRCISVGCAPPYKCVRRLLGGCDCRPGKLCPSAPDPASGKCVRELRRDGNYLVCCPKYYGYGDPCCRVYPIPSRVQPATEFNLFDELEDEFEEEAMELEPVFPSPAMKHLRRGSADHQLLDFPEFEDKAAIAQRKLAQKKLLDFRTNVHLRPPDYRKLILTARLHPFPGRSRVISSFPVPNYGSGLLSLVLEGFLGSTEPGELVQEVWAQILHELRAIADRKLAHEIAAENRLTNDAADVIKVHLKKFKIGRAHV